MLYGKNLFPLGKSLKLSNGIQAPLIANYYPSHDTFIIEYSQLEIGKTYVVSADWVSIPLNLQQIVIPELIKVIQVNKRQIKLIFNTDVSKESAVNNYNYWISCDQPGTTSIATLGENDSRFFNNSLKPYNSFISRLGCLKNEFLILFTKDITTGIKYKVMPYGISSLGLSDYIGPNFTSNSDITFTGL